MPNITRAKTASTKRKFEDPQSLQHNKRTIYSRSKKTTSSNKNEVSFVNIKPKRIKFDEKYPLIDVCNQCLIYRSFENKEIILVSFIEETPNTKILLDNHNIFDCKFLSDEKILFLVENIETKNWFIRFYDIFQPEAGNLELNSGVEIEGLKTLVLNEVKLLVIKNDQAILITKHTIYLIKQTEKTEDNEICPFFVISTIIGEQSGKNYSISINTSFITDQGDIAFIIEKDNLVGKKEFLFVILDLNGTVKVKFKMNTEINIVNIKKITSNKNCLCILHANELLFWEFNDSSSNCKPYKSNLDKKHFVEDFQITDSGEVIFISQTNPNKEIIKWYPKGRCIETIYAILAASFYGNHIIYFKDNKNTLHVSLNSKINTETPTKKRLNTDKDSFEIHGDNIIFYKKNKASIMSIYNILADGEIVN